MLSEKSKQNVIDLIIEPKNIYLQKSEIQGMGVFAGKKFELNNIIETFPLMPLSFRTNYQADPVIYNYSYVNYHCSCAECKQHGYVIYLPMGYGNMYNHQEKTQVNARVKCYFDSFYAEVIAMKTIEQYSEIYIDYGLRYLFRDGKVLKHENHQ